MNVLTQHQSEKQDDVLEILKTSKRVSIKGSAGVGKTYMVDSLLEALKHDFGNRDIYCSAPTNKAVAVLSGKINLIHPKLSFITTYSALKYGKVTNNKTGESVFKPKFDPRTPPLQGVGLLIIDEASMLPLQLLMDVEKYASMYGVTVIFIGDDKQINPVKEEDSPVFWGKPKPFSTYQEAADYTFNHKIGVLSKNTTIYVPQIKDENEQIQYIGFAEYPYVELTEIVRQGEGNSIITLSRNLQEIWKRENRVTGDENEMKGFIYTSNEWKIIEELSRVNGTDEFKYLAWTNDEVDRMNSLVRKNIYGEPAKIELGETMVFDEPYGDYYTNQEVTVHKLDIETLNFKVQTEDMRGRNVSTTISLKVYIINGHQQESIWKDSPPEWTGIFVIHESSEWAYKQMFFTLSNNCKKGVLKYTTREQYTGNFAKLKYNHAITVHKSQGSTYKNTVLNVGDINSNRNNVEKTRLFYTGVTRASDLLILYNV